MPRRDEHQFLQQVLQGDPDAIAFCETLFRLSQLIDDLVDGDGDITEAQVIRAFWDALIELPGNPFYRQHEPWLRPQMALALQDWRDSVTLERNGGPHGQTLAFVLRDQLTALVIQCARLVGGYDWMVQVAPQVRLHFHDEPLQAYLTEHNPAQPEAQPEAGMPPTGGLAL